MADLAACCCCPWQDPTTCSFTVSVTGDPYRGEESSVRTTDVALPMPQSASLVQKLSTNILSGGAAAVAQRGAVAAARAHSCEPAAAEPHAC